MKYVRISIATCLAVIPAGTVHAMQAPDYLSHIDAFKFASKMATSTASCKRLGLIVDSEGMSRYADSTITDAVKDGLSVESASTLLLSELRDESARQDHIVDNFVKNYKATESKKDTGAMDSFLGYWTERCTSLANDERSSRYFKIPPEGIKDIIPDP